MTRYNLHCFCERNPLKFKVDSPVLRQQSLDHFGRFDADEFLVETLERESVFVGIDAEKMK
jgi:hypothetical protein